MTIKLKYLVVITVTYLVAISHLKIRLAVIKHDDLSYF